MLALQRSTSAVVCARAHTRTHWESVPTLSSLPGNGEISVRMCIFTHYNGRGTLNDCCTSVSHSFALGCINSALSFNCCRVGFASGWYRNFLWVTWIFVCHCSADQCYCFADIKCALWTNAIPLNKSVLIKKKNDWTALPLLSVPITRKYFVWFLVYTVVIAVFPFYE